MKIILTFGDMAPGAMDIIIEWMQGIVADKSLENLSPLRYVDKIEVER